MRNSSQDLSLTVNESQLLVVDCQSRFEEIRF